MKRITLLLGLLGLSMSALAQPQVLLLEPGDWFAVGPTNGPKFGLQAQSALAVSAYPKPCPYVGQENENTRLYQVEGRLIGIWKEDTAGTYSLNQATLRRLRALSDTALAVWQYKAAPDARLVLALERTVGRSLDTVFLRIRPDDVRLAPSSLPDTTAFSDLAALALQPSPPPVKLAVTVVVLGSGLVAAWSTLDEASKQASAGIRRFAEFCARAHRAHATHAALTGVMYMTAEELLDLPEEEFKESIDDWVGQTGLDILEQLHQLEETDEITKAIEYWKHLTQRDPEGPQKPQWRKLLASLTILSTAGVMAHDYLREALEVRLARQQAEALVPLLRGTQGLADWSAELDELFPELAAFLPARDVSAEDTLDALLTIARHVLAVELAYHGAADELVQALDAAFTQGATDRYRPLDKQYHAQLILAAQTSLDGKMYRLARTVFGYARFNHLRSPGMTGDQIVADWAVRHLRLSDVSILPVGAGYDLYFDFENREEVCGVVIAPKSPYAEVSFEIEGREYVLIPRGGTMCLRVYEPLRGGQALDHTIPLTYLGVSPDNVEALFEILADVRARIMQWRQEVVMQAATDVYQAVAAFEGQLVHSRLAVETVLDGGPSEVAETFFVRSPDGDATFVVFLPGTLYSVEVSRIITDRPEIAIALNGNVFVRGVVTSEGLQVDGEIVSEELWGSVMDMVKEELEVARRWFDTYVTEVLDHLQNQEREFVRAYRQRDSIGWVLVMSTSATHYDTLYLQPPNEMRQPGDDRPFLYAEPVGRADAIRLVLESEWDATFVGAFGHEIVLTRWPEPAATMVVGTRFGQEHLRIPVTQVMGLLRAVLEGI